MKRFVFLLCVLFLTLQYGSVEAAKIAPISGKVVNADQVAISYATVVLSQNEEQVAGTATDDEGAFSIAVAEGEYEISISYVGYKGYEKVVRAGEDLGVISLEAESSEIGEVVVVSNFIRREADRFVVDVANAPSAIGQDGEELLKSSPSVWVNDDEISINGNSGVKVYVNDRELKMSDDQVLTYLRSLSSDDVRRIEVIPQTGADFDASTSSGVIMIYLKRQLKSGIVGNVSFKGSYSSDLQQLSPSVSLNYQSEKLTLNTSAWYGNNSYDSYADITTNYTDLDTTLIELSESESQNESGGGRIEAIYQLNDRHSVGGEVRYFTRDNNSLSTSDSNSTFDSKGEGQNISATFNYIYKLDTLGSTLKLLADYNSNESDNFSDNRSLLDESDSLYRSTSATQFKVATVTLAAEKIVSPKLSLKAGLKYTNNDMDSRSSYTYLDSNEWVDLDAYNSDELYTENIGAAYVTASSRQGRWSLVAGVRAEYTQTKGRDDLLNKNYTSLFPNFNASYMIDATGVNMVSAQYSRSISRPSFWSLNPKRNQTSDYFYTIGNPALKPQYTNDLSLTYIYKYKYTLTAMMKISENVVQQILMQDEENPAVTYIIPQNMDSQRDFYLVANLPFQFTPWWSLNANLIYVNRNEAIDADSAAKTQNIYISSLQTTFTLPKKFYLGVNCYAMSDVWSGNMHVDANNYISVSLRKRFFNDKLSAAITANNIFTNDVVATSTTDGVEQVLVSRNGWNRARAGFSLTYNFKAGKEHSRRQGIESASAEDQARLQGDDKGQE